MFLLVSQYGLDQLLTMWRHLLGRIEDHVHAYKCGNALKRQNSSKIHMETVPLKPLNPSYHYASKHGKEYV